jgi:hypothetical protein
MKIRTIALVLVALIGLASADLVANWIFDEGSGSYANDTSPFGNNCTINNASWVSGVNSNALEFNGFDSYLECGNDTSLNAIMSQDSTMMLWLKGIASNEFLIKTDPTEFNYSAMFQESGRLGCVYYYNAEEELLCELTDAINSNIWYHFACVRNSSGVVLYLNGVLNNSCNGSVTSTNNIYNLTIGGWVGNYYFNGTIDEVKIWNESKDASFILQTYNSEKPVSINVILLNTVVIVIVLPTNVISYPLSIPLLLSFLPKDDGFLKMSPIYGMVLLVGGVSSLFALYFWRRKNGIQPNEASEEPYEGGDEFENGNEDEELE